MTPGHLHAAQHTDIKQDVTDRSALTTRTQLMKLRKCLHTEWSCESSKISSTFQAAVNSFLESVYRYTV